MEINPNQQPTHIPHQPFLIAVAIVLIVIYQEMCIQNTSQFALPVSIRELCVIHLIVRTPNWLLSVLWLAATAMHAAQKRTDPILSRYVVCGRMLDHTCLKEHTKMGNITQCPMTFVFFHGSGWECSSIG